MVHDGGNKKRRWVILLDQPKQRRKKPSNGNIFVAYFLTICSLPIFFLNHWIFLCQALEAPREPRRPKTHWDHVLEEMVWLSKVSIYLFQSQHLKCLIRTYFNLHDFACYTFCFAGLRVREEVEISSGKESCFKSQQRHVRSGYKRWKEDKGSDFSSIN